MSSNENEFVVQVEGLSRRFRKKVALDNVSLTVPQGRVFGLVGENGAGKTTLIKHLLGALTPQQGSVRVFGADPTRDPVAVLSRVGYLSEDRDLPGWMRVREFMRYTQAFFPDWDEAYAEKLREHFGLPEDAKIRNLSRGEMARVGLLAAQAHRPDLLLLDEPSSGLDPVARHDILAAVVRSVAEEGRSVIFSSHLLEEVERVADDVAMIHHGKVVLHMPMDELRSSHRKLLVRFTQPVAVFPTLPGTLHAEGEGQEWAVMVDGGAEAFKAALPGVGGAIIEETSPSLDAVFVARVTGGRVKAGVEDK